MIGYIYLARNTKDNMIYVGQTRKSLEERKKSHKKLAKYYPFRICQAIVADGFDAFTWEVLEEVEGVDKADMQVKLNEAERKYISMYKSHDPSVGYNDTYGGRDGRLVERVIGRREETRKKNAKGKPPRHHSEEVRQKMCVAQKKRHRDKPMSDESRRKQREGIINYYSNPINRKKHGDAIRGKKLTEEHRERIKNGQKNAKPVVCVETGVIYASVKEAARVLHTTPDNIRKSINNCKKVKGATFSFVKENSLHNEG